MNSSLLVHCFYNNKCSILYSNKEPSHHGTPNVEQNNTTNDRDAIITFFANSTKSTIFACPCDIFFGKYKCLKSVPKLAVTAIELLWCLRSTNSNNHIGALHSLVVTHGHHVSVRIRDGIALYETFPTTMDIDNHVVRTYMESGFGGLVRRGFRAISHKSISIYGAVHVAGELQPFSINFPVKSIRFLPILKGSSWEHPGDRGYWIVRCSFLMLCLATPVLLLWCVRKIWFWKPLKTLGNIYGVPSRTEIPGTEVCPEDVENLKLKESKEEKGKNTMRQASDILGDVEICLTDVPI